MRYLRRLLQVAALTGTLMVGVLALALIVSQTPWFKDWLRRYIVRESKQYLNGELSIGGLGGNLLFGVDLTDVAVDVSGERVVSARALELDYSVFEMVSKGIVLDQISIDRPVLRLQHDASGWSLANLVRKERREADRRGPMRPISLPAITVTDATLAIQDAVGTSGVAVPEAIGDLDIKAGFEYAPVHYSLTLDHVSFHGSKPDVAVRQLTGKISVRDDNLYLDRIDLKTPESSVTVDGVVERYLSAPLVKVTAAGTVSMPEVGRLVAAARGYTLTPEFTVKANGLARQLTLDVTSRSAAGAIKGQLVADVESPDFAARGNLDVDRLDLAPILKNPAQKSDLSGHGRIDLRLASKPAGASVVERLRGTYAFEGPHVAAAGYEARNVKVTGSLDGPRITLDGRAAAYGGTGTARGVLILPAPGRPFGFDLRGSADHLDLRNLPVRLGAPRLASSFSVPEYHVSGRGPAIEGTATLGTSMVEGATLAAGTAGGFSVTPTSVAYGARGSVSDLDVRRIGRGLKVASLDIPAYDGRVNGTFDVKGTVPRTPARGRRAAGEEPAPIARTITLDASGAVHDTDLMGGRLPEMGFEAHLDRGALKVRANGQFANFNPARLSDRQELDGRVTGSVDATVEIADVTAPLTPASVTAGGSLALEPSTAGGLDIEQATVEGTYASQTGDITKLQVNGPDLKVDASGHVALDRAGASNLKYHVEAIGLGALAKLAGQDGVGGMAVVDGTMTGNAAALGFTGTLNGSNLSYADANALDLNSRYTVTVPDLVFANARVEATSNATFVKAGGLEINAIQATTTYAARALDFSTNVREKTREVDANGRVIFHPDHQEIHLPGLALRTQGVEWKMAPDANATVKYGQHRVELENVRLTSGDQTLDVRGAFALEADAPTGTIETHAKNVNLQQLETLLLQNRGFTGTLDADATISGSTAAPKVDGELRVTNGGFRTYRYESLTAKVNYAGTRVGIDATLQQSPAESITARGSVPTTLFQTSGSAGHVEPPAGEQIDLQVTSSAIGLAMVQGFTTQVTDVTGTLQADVHVVGSGQDPHLSGFVDIKNGAFTLPAVGESYSGLTTRIDLQPDRVKIQDFAILDRHKERLNVSGEIAVHERQIGGVNIAIDSDNFELVHNELGDVQVQSALKVTGELRRPRVEGDVRLDAGRVEIDKVLALTYDPYSEKSLPDVVSAERAVEKSGSAEQATKEALLKAQQAAAPPAAKTAEAETPVEPSVFDALGLNVHVLIPDNLVLRGKDIRPGGPTGAALGDVNITVGGDLYVRKEPGGPIAPVGTITTVRGIYNFQSRRFDLVRGGTLRFTGESEINPLVDVSATRTIPNTGVEARVHITGSARVPELKLSSNPPLEESDVLALIVFNRPVNELGTGERSSLAATAGGIATGFIASPLGESIGRALDLDLFEITTTTENGELGAGITLGQQVGDKAFLKLRQQFGSQSTTEFLVEYNLARFLRLEASAAPETSGSANRINQRRVERAGVNLIFFFSY
jgi:translocation and assembly module TamB